MSQNKFCEDEIKWIEIFDVFQGIYDKSQDIKNVSPLQGIALARLMSEELGDFLDKLTQISFKAIICEVLNHYDIDLKIDEVQDKITNLFDDFNQLDDAIANIQKGDNESLEDLINSVSPIFDNFISEKEDIDKIIDEKIAQLFQPLTELGASESEIKDALEEVEFNSSPSEYIVEVFLNITDRTLQNLN